MRSIVFILGITLAGVIAPSAAQGVTVLVPNVDGGAEDLRVTSLGATTAFSVGYGSHVVGPAGEADMWARPIVQFPVSSFASLTGLSVLSATLHYSIVTDVTEPGESAVSQVRLFTTTETELSLTNRDVFAGLSGDGGAHAVVGSAYFVDGVTGAQSLAFSPAALTALQVAINGADPTLVISFREFAVYAGIGRPDLLDEFMLGIPPGNVSIEITAVPEPGTVGPLALTGFLLLRRRQRQGWLRLGVEGLAERAVCREVGSSLAGSAGRSLVGGGWGR